MVLQQIHILEEMSLASLSQKEQLLVGLLFFSLLDILVWNVINSCQCFHRIFIWKLCEEP